MTDAWVLLLFRILLRIAGGFLLGSTLLVVWTHIKEWRRRDGALLPLHVWSIALSYDLFLFLTMTRIWPLDWRTPFLVIAIGLGSVGMLVLLKHQRRDRATNE